ncbi:MAG: hypothetical protein KKD63_00305 [Proteobacteria bacterium]|nr:hypothetical protein [Desulfobulbaceae bacterium]MBU4151298.1 hypothetical protein [Pseudomonadota bacterium]MDP2106084.1 hypothetical protein [Desulfobulbaceae bacterium]
MGTKRMSLPVVLVIILLFLSGCAPGILLRTRMLKTIGPDPGSYDLILYGGQNPHDFRTVAILDRTDDQYAIIPFGAAFNYRIIKGLPAAEALEMGSRFISDITAFRAEEMREIYGPKNIVIGYELRPVYMPLTTGWLGDILITSYHLIEKGHVTVYVSFRGENSFDMPESSRNGLR